MADSGSASSASDGARTTNNPLPPDVLPRTMADEIRNRLAMVYGYRWQSVEVTAILALADEIDRRFDKIEARMTNGGL